MPHIQLKMYPGVTEHNKNKLAIELTELLMSYTSKPVTAFSVDIVEVDPENWMTEVYNTEIKPNIDRLYKKPGY